MNHHKGKKEKMFSQDQMGYRVKSIKEIFQREKDPD